MRSCVLGCGNAFPDVHRDTVAGDTDVIFATSVPFNPPRSRRSSSILATALAISKLPGARIQFQVQRLLSPATAPIRCGPAMTVLPTALDRRSEGFRGNKTAMQALVADLRE